jgi:hypothetical protein
LRPADNGIGRVGAEFLHDVVDVQEIEATKSVAARIGTDA